MDQIFLILLISFFQVPSVFDKQGAQLFAVSLLVVSRTIISDRIASLNGMFNVLYLQWDKKTHVLMILNVHLSQKKCLLSQEQA